MHIKVKPIMFDTAVELPDLRELTYHNDNAVGAEAAEGFAGMAVNVHDAKGMVVGVLAWYPNAKLGEYYTTIG